MDRTVVFVIGNEEYNLGSIEGLLATEYHPTLLQAIRDIVEDVAFSPDSHDYVVCSVEVRQ